jgi:hypothetical protein
MKKRCLNKNSHAYPRYGGRGIAVCDRWMDFESFANDMGEPPSKKHSIERKDNALGYSPENCVWATDKEQVANRSNTHTLVLNGVELTLADAADQLGLKYSTAYYRYVLHKSRFSLGEA